MRRQAARGKSPPAFERRCIPPERVFVRGVPPRAPLGATRDFCRGLLGKAACIGIVTGLAFVAGAAYSDPDNDYLEHRENLQWCQYWCSDRGSQVECTSPEADYCDPGHITHSGRNGFHTHSYCFLIYTYRDGVPACGPDVDLATVTGEKWIGVGVGVGWEKTEACILQEKYRREDQCEWAVEGAPDQSDDPPNSTSTVGEIDDLGWRYRPWRYVEWNEED